MSAGPPAAPTAFEDDTAARPAGPGRYRVALNDRWWIGPGPNGGYVAALMLRAMTETVTESVAAAATAQPPRSLTVHFLKRPSVGPAEVEVTVEHSGRSTSFLSARLIQDGEVEAKAMAVFSGEREGPAFDNSTMPDVPAPEEGEEFDTQQAPVAVFTQYRAIPVRGIPYAGEPRAETLGWIRLREDQPMTAVLAAAMLDVWWPAPFVALQEQALAPTLEYTVHFPRVLPVTGDGAPDWSLVRLVADEAGEGHFSEDGELWSRDGTLLARCRQVALLRHPR